MTPRQKSFSKRLSLNILVVTSILFITMSVFAALSSHALIAQEAQGSSKNLLEYTIKDVEAEFQQVENEVCSATWFLRLNKLDETFLYKITRGLITSNPRVVGSAIAFAPDYFPGKHFYAPYSYRDGEKILSKQLGNAKYNYFQMEWYSEAAESKKGIWSEPYFDEGGANILMSTYSLPVLDSDGKVFAIITADVALEWICQRMNSIKPYPSAYVDLVSRKGTFINSGMNGEYIGASLLDFTAKLGNPKIEEIAQRMVRGENGMERFMQNKKGFFAVFAPMKNGWEMAIICSYREVLARSTQLHIIMFFICLAGLVLMFIMCYRIIKRLTKPLTQFSDAALSIASGNFNTPLPEVDYDDEIRQMRDSFDFMQQSLTSYIDDLQKTTAANERMSGELNVATKIQMGMLPKKFPECKEVDVYACMEPAKEVGGDMYDFYQNGDDLYFCVGDVSGKGVPAALIMSLIRAVFHFSARLGMGLTDLVKRLNDSSSENNVYNMFVTFFAGKLNLRTGHLTYCNAGHNPIIFISADGKAEYLKVKSNLALGVMSEFPYESQELVMEKGSRLVLYTDGVSEAENRSKDQFGEDRLIRWAGEVAPQCHGADVACKSLQSTVAGFVDGAEQNDDITIMTLKYYG